MSQERNDEFFETNELEMANRSVRRPTTTQMFKQSAVKVAKKRVSLIATLIWALLSGGGTFAGMNMIAGDESQEEVRELERELDMCTTLRELERHRNE